jgi:hypothetical protein
LPDVTVRITSVSKACAGGGKSRGCSSATDVGDGAIALLGMRALMRDLVAPPPKLRVELLNVAERARRKERVPQVLNLALDFPVLIPRSGVYGRGAK